MGEHQHFRRVESWTETNYNQRSGLHWTGCKGERDDGSNVLGFSMLAHKLWSVLNLEAWARQWS